MIDKKILEERGITVEGFRKKFEIPGDNIDGGYIHPDEKIEQLLNNVRSRIQNGIDWNTRNFRTFHALDLAWDTPFRQITETLVQDIIAKNTVSDKKKVLAAFQEFGLHNLIEEAVDSKGNKQPKLNIPVFFKIFVPLVRSYVTIRWAKIYNDRRLFPLLKYEPLQSTPLNRLRCEIITDRVQVMATQYDYKSILKQAIFHTLHYGECMLFPTEKWHTESQLHRRSSDIPEETIVKEGLRYQIPHPSRYYYDRNDRPSTFNSDTGCEYAGYWRIQRYGVVRKNEHYYNTGRIKYSRDLKRSNGTFFNTVYRDCTLAFPDKDSSGHNIGGDTDRENQIDIYTSEDDDSAIVLNEHFEKIIPSEYGLGDYDYPIWVRFVMAGETTPVYVEPMCYCPVVWWGYDAHEGRARNPSMSLEILPFQDHIGNLLTQQILTIKQNLSNITFLDKDQIGPEAQEQIENIGNNLYTSRNFISFSGSNNRFGLKDPKQAVYDVRMQPIQTNELASAIPQLLGILERVMVFSAQEVGAAASHEQTAEEVRNIQNSTSNRLQFTASAIDDSIYSWKQQLFRALMAYGSEWFYAKINADYNEELITKLGFSVVEDDADNYGMVVKGKKSKVVSRIPMEFFASERDAYDRTNNVAIGHALNQLMAQFPGNELLMESVGVKQYIGFINEVSKMLGLPRDYKLRIRQDAPDTPTELQVEAAKKQMMTQQAQEAMAQGKQEESQQLMDQMSKDVLMPLADQIKQIGDMAMKTNEKLMQLEEKQKEARSKK